MLLLAIIAVVLVFFFIAGINLYTICLGLICYFLYGFAINHNKPKDQPHDENNENQTAQQQPVHGETDGNDENDHNPRPYGGVIWDDEYTIDELIYKNGKYYINENSEEWEEDEEDK